jgi:hypothetical protein
VAENSRRKPDELDSLFDVAADVGLRMDDAEILEEYEMLFGADARPSITDELLGFFRDVEHNRITTARLEHQKLVAELEEWLRRTDAPFDPGSTVEAQIYRGISPAGVAAHRAVTAYFRNRKDVSPIEFDVAMEQLSFADRLQQRGSNAADIVFAMGLSATEILRRLGIGEPEDIDLAAIAHACGALIVFEENDHFEGRILGVGHRAVITISTSVSKERHKYTAAHEIGHWMQDRHSMTVCSREAIGFKTQANASERRANEFAAELTMPPFMFAPLLAKGAFGFTTVRELAHRFQTSLISTAIQVALLSVRPTVFVVAKAGERPYFQPRPGKQTTFPYQTLRRSPGPATKAQALLQGRKLTEHFVDVPATEWFLDVQNANRMVREDSFLVADGVVYTLLQALD